MDRQTWNWIRQPAADALAAAPVEAEVIWDLQRSVAGTLDLALYELPIAPAAGRAGADRQLPHGPPACRRSPTAAGCTSWSSARSAPDAQRFDLPDNVNSCGQRDSTIVPNSAGALEQPAVQGAGRAFAGRLLRRPTAARPRSRRWPGSTPTGAPSRTRSGTRVGSFCRRAAALGDDRRAVEELCVALFNTSESFICLARRRQSIARASAPGSVCREGYWSPGGATGQADRPSGLKPNTFARRSGADAPGYRLPPLWGYTREEPHERNSGVNLSAKLAQSRRLRHRRLGASGPLGARRPRRPAAARPRVNPLAAAAALPGPGPLCYLPDDGRRPSR